MPKFSFESNYENPDLHLNLVHDASGNKILKMEMEIDKFQYMDDGWKIGIFPVGADLNANVNLNEEELALVLNNLKSFVIFGNLDEDYLNSVGQKISESKRGFKLNNIKNISIQRSSNGSGAYLWFGFNDPDVITYKDENGKDQVFNHHHYNSFLLNNRLHINQLQAAYLLDLFNAVWNEAPVPEMKSVPQNYTSSIFEYNFLLSAVTNRLDSTYEEIKDGNNISLVDAEIIFKDLLTYIFDQNNSKYLLSFDSNAVFYSGFGALSHDVIYWWAYINHLKTLLPIEELKSTIEAAWGESYFKETDYKKENFLKKLNNLEQVKILEG